MTIKKKLLSFIMIIFLTFVSVTGIYFDTCAYANSLTDYGDLFSTFVQLVGANDDVPINVLDSLIFDAICPYDAGFLVRTVDRANYDLTKKVIANYLNEKYSNQDKTKDNLTQSDINEYARDLNQNVTYTDNSTTYNDNSRDMINLAINTFVDANKYYVGYSLDMQYYPVPDYFKDFISSKQGANYVFCRDVYNGTANGLRYEIYVVSKDVFDISFVYYNSDYNVNGQYNQICASIFDNLTFQGVSILNNSNVQVYNVVCNSTASGYGQINDGGLSTRNIRFVSFLDNSFDYRYDDFPFGSRTNQNGCILISNERIESYPIFGTYELFTSAQRGKMPYYYNNNVYTDFSSSVGDYTVNTDNRNYVTYGDVTTYIDDHHTETGEYPSIPEINVWIESQPSPTPLPTPTPNPDNPSGGGGSGSFVNNNNPSITNNPTFNNNPNINVTLFPSVSGNTVSGNGAGSEGGIGSIFGWLGDLGQVIGDLIKNLGEAIKNIVIGISDLITSIVTDLPTMFFDFVGAFFGWMPPEWSTLLSLSLAAMLIFGIIKIFRG